ncbi:hypothetical protein BsWGS_05417 [Bradybaena similaris]
MLTLIPHLYVSSDNSQHLKSLLLTVHAMLRWLSCLPTAFYPVFNQSFLKLIFPHAMKPNYSTLSLLVFPCLSSPPIFLLTQHIQVLPFSSHDQRMLTVFF